MLDAGASGHQLRKFIAREFKINSDLQNGMDITTDVLFVNISSAEVHSNLYLVAKELKNLTIHVLTEKCHVFYYPRELWGDTISVGSTEGVVQTLILIP